jgi:RHS repeat-associated protein
MYYHLDAVGSVRLITDENRTVVAAHDYKPFGEDTGALTGDPRRFTGKELDAETALHYFGARYYRNVAGRFTSSDPSLAGVQLGDPQSWNRYAYAKNNPLRYVDRNGKWPTYVHERIIDDVFRGRMLASQLRILKDASKDVDADQNTENAFKHGMSGGREVRREDRVSASIRAGNFIAGQLEMAVRLQVAWKQSHPSARRGEFSSAALYAFGEALHTATDSVSPWHTGAQAWFGLADPLESFKHSAAESLIGWSASLEIGLAEYEAMLLWNEFLSRVEAGVNSGGG